MRLWNGELSTATLISRLCANLRIYAYGPQRTIPSLDGLRAISIAFVILGHLAGTRNFPLSLSPRAVPAEFGVRVFFVISGYLITSILRAEMEKTGTVALGRFYFRRTLRLFPACYALIAATALLAAAGLVKLHRWNLLFGVTYLMNYDDNRGWALGHLWSLGVEEQFYVLWPLLLRSLGLRRALWPLLAICTSAPLFRLASPYVHSAFNFLVWSDALGTGCLLALVRERLAHKSRYQRLIKSRWFFLVPLISLLANYIPSTKLSWLVGGSIMNVTIAISADWAMRNPSGVVGKFLNLPSMALLGALSYSLYLWQQMFLDRESGQAFCAFPLNLTLAVAVALISCLLVEAPFLRLRRALERRAEIEVPDNLR